MQQHAWCVVGSLTTVLFQISSFFPVKKVLKSANTNGDFVDISVVTYFFGPLCATHRHDGFAENKQTLGLNKLIISRFSIW